MSWVLHHSPATGTDKVILLGIANHADSDGGNAWPSVATLATYARVSQRTVQESLRRLTAAGHLSVELQAGGTRQTRADRRPNLYTIHGVKPTAPGARDGVKVDVERGEVSRTHGVKPTAPEPSLEPSVEPSKVKTSAPLARKDEEIDPRLAEDARACAQFAFEQNPKPITRFVAVLDRCREVLSAGVHPDELCAVIAQGDVTWTRTALEFRLGQVKGARSGGGPKSAAAMAADYARSHR